MAISVGIIVKQLILMFLAVRAPCNDGRQIYSVLRKDVDITGDTVAQLHRDVALEENMAAERARFRTDESSFSVATLGLNPG